MVDSRTAWTLARFGFEGGDTSFLGYHNGRKWNGFPCAYFELSEAKRLASHLVQDPDAGYGGLFFEKTSDTLALFRADTADAVRIKGEDIAFDGRTVHVYGVGEGLTLHIGPALCESCDREYLTEDFQCPKCGVNHAGDACQTCGRFGFHKDDCTEPPHGNGFEGGPAYVAPEPAPRTSEERIAEERALVKVFESQYETYNGWGFAFEHPGYFSYYQKTGDLTVLFTPDFNEQDVVDVQVASSDGDHFDGIGEGHPFKADRSAAALFNIVKPYLDRLAGKSAAELSKELKKN